tara:strand:+ start:841 stop:1233 length:393 start_codon:yes stop_codon:yes gene_type:complete
MLPTYLDNPFIESTNNYRTGEVLSNVTANDLQYVMFKDIHIRTFEIKKIKLVGADTRYPPLLYESALSFDEKHVAQRYCVRDGTHRLLKMKAEGKQSAVCFILKPSAFDNLESFSKLPMLEDINCGSCQE